MTEKSFEEIQHGSVYFRDGSYILVAIEDVDRLREGLISRETFMDTVGVFGQTICIRMSEVNAISKWDQADCDVMHEDNERLKAKKLLEGGDA